MTTLQDIRDRIRIDLHDEDAQRWSDEVLDRHIARALGDIDNAVPRETSAQLGTTPGSRDIDIGSLSALIRVEAVEYPVGRYPPEHVPFSQWENGLTLQGPTVPGGDDARVFYTARHELDGTGTTLPAHLEGILATGAAAYALLEQAPATTNALTTGGPSVPRDFEALGRAWLMAFRELLRQHARERRPRARRLYTPA
jgi:hypothetical protein